MILAEVSDGEQRVAWMAAAQKLTAPVMPWLAGCEDQLAVQVRIKSIEMKSPAAAFLDVWTQNQGKVVASTICDIRPRKR